MFAWNEKYHWEFSPAGYTDPDCGPAITGAGIFRGGKYLNAVRECAQNGADAKAPDLPADVPVKMTFELLYIDKTDLPGVSRLADVIDKGYEYINSINAKVDDVESLKAASDRYLRRESVIPVLKISDYNTVGLKDDRFEKLLRMEGITNKKDQDSAGAFGYGKYAPFLLSTVNTILYATLTSDGKYLFQGRSLQATFVDGNVKMKGSSLYGYEDVDAHTFNPITDYNDVPDVFKRQECGTDLYVLCFEKCDDWIDQMVICALENFFYSVYSNRLEFEFSDSNTRIQITKSNLNELIERYRVIYEQKYSEVDGFTRFTAPVYWKVLNDQRKVVDIKSNFRNKGEVKLFILMGDDVEGRSVLEMRSLGMKIQEDPKEFRGLPPFNGILIATGAGKETADYGGNISKFLLKLEGPAHDSWVLDNVKIENIKGEAQKVIDELHSWIREVVKKQLPADDGSPVDAFGLSRILPDVTTQGEERIKEDAVFTFKPCPISPEVVREKKPSGKRTSSGRGQGDGPVPGPGPNHGPGPKPGPGPNPGLGPGPSPTPDPQKERVFPVMLKSKNSPYIANSKRYRVSVISEKDADPLLLQIKISGDDSSSFESVVTGAWYEGQKLPIYNGLIAVPHVKRNNKVICEVALTENEGCALEVTAYAKK